MDAADQNSRLLMRLLARLADWEILEVLKSNANGDFYIFGGAVRRALFDVPPSNDIDLLIPNGDGRVLAALDALKIPYTFCRHGHRRYNFRSKQIDIFQPCEFYGGFIDVEAALRFMDLKIDSLALHYRENTLLDPLRVISTKRPDDVGINWLRWEQMSCFELTVLSIRMLRIMREIPHLIISKSDADRLRKDVIPAISKIDWTSVCDRLPGSKEEFLRDFSHCLISRTMWQTALTWPKVRTSPGGQGGRTKSRRGRL
jgi:hypothetical protein